MTRRIGAGKIKGNISLDGEVNGINETFKINEIQNSISAGSTDTVTVALDKQNQEGAVMLFVAGSFFSKQAGLFLILTPSASEASSYNVTGGTNYGQVYSKFAGASVLSGGEFEVGEGIDDVQLTDANIDNTGTQLSFTFTNTAPTSVIYSVQGVGQVLQS